MYQELGYPQLLCNSTVSHLVPGKEGTVPKLDFLSPTPLWKLQGLLNTCLSLERHRGPFPPASPSSQDTDLYGIIHQSLEQQCLPSSGWRQQGTGQSRPRTTTLGQLTACPGSCPAQPTWLCPGDLQRRKKAYAASRPVDPAISRQVPC